MSTETQEIIWYIWLCIIFITMFIHIFYMIKDYKLRKKALDYARKKQE